MWNGRIRNWKARSRNTSWISKRRLSPIADFLQRRFHCVHASGGVPPANSLRSLYMPLLHTERVNQDSSIRIFCPTLQRDPASIATPDKHFVAIGQANPSGQGQLPSVGAELVNIGQLVGDVAAFTRVDGEESCISRVVEEWVHFACYGLLHRSQPFESAFSLRDGRFTIERLIGCDLKHAEFAYLSACHTTVGDEEGSDEVIHLASAMQFIGFRSVIGTR